MHCGVALQKGSLTLAQQGGSPYLLRVDPFGFGFTAARSERNRTTSVSPDPTDVRSAVKIPAAA